MRVVSKSSARQGPAGGPHHVGQAGEDPGPAGPSWGRPVGQRVQAQVGAGHGLGASSRSAQVRTAVVWTPWPHRAAHGAQGGQGVLRLGSSPIGTGRGTTRRGCCRRRSRSPGRDPCTASRQAGTPYGPCVATVAGGAESPHGAHDDPPHAARRGAQPILYGRLPGYHLSTLGHQDATQQARRPVRLRAMTSPGSSPHPEEFEHRRPPPRLGLGADDGSPIHRGRATPSRAWPSTATAGSWPN